MNATKMMAFVDSRPIGDVYAGPLPVSYRQSQYGTMYRDWLVPANRLAEYFPVDDATAIGVVEEMWPAGEGPLSMRFMQRPCGRMVDGSYGPTYTWSVSRPSLKMWMDGTYPSIEVSPHVGRGEGEYLPFVVVKMTAGGKVELAREWCRGRRGSVEYYIGTGWEEDVATVLAAVKAFIG